LPELAQPAVIQGGMKCPLCVEPDLVMSERQGIEIDYCPKCRGVWLDRGELDKLIERSAGAQVAAPAPDPRQHADPRQHYRDSDDYRHRRKKKGFLGEIFDFD
jgi:Zn-finger nucleic acid-binding protein